MIAIRQKQRREADGNKHPALLVVQESTYHQSMTHVVSIIYTSYKMNVVIFLSSSLSICQLMLSNAIGGDIQ